jgi:anti-anti-sigma regulatory factor
MSMITNPSGFGITIIPDGGSMTLVLRGRFVKHAAFALGARLDWVIDQHPESVVLDLFDLEFMGATAMLAVFNAEQRLADLGSQLTVRSPSVLINRLLDVKATAAETKLERALPGHGHLGPEDPSDVSFASPPFAAERPTSDQHGMTALPAESKLVDGALSLLIELVKSGVRCADGVSVSLLRHNVLSTVVSSDETIMAMDADQYATGEGPCIDASVRGHWFHAESLDTETRWPSFTPQARGLGIKAILSLPLTAFEEPVGALNIYSRTAKTFETNDQETAAAFARRASAILSDARAGVSDTQMALRYKEALRSREIITLATGVLMERVGIDEDDAFTALLRLSLRDGEPVHHRAEAVVFSSQQPKLGAAFNE